MAGLAPFELIVFAAAMLTFVGTLFAWSNGRYRLKAGLYGVFCLLAGVWWLATSDGTVDSLLGLAWVGLGCWQAFRVATVEDPDSAFAPWWQSE